MEYESGQLHAARVALLSRGRLLQFGPRVGLTIIVNYISADHGMSSFDPRLVGKLVYDMSQCAPPCLSLIQLPVTLLITAAGVWTLASQLSSLSSCCDVPSLCGQPVSLCPADRVLVRLAGERVPYASGHQLSDLAPTLGSL